MKIIKKIISLLICACMFLGVTACKLTQSESSGDSSGTTVKYDTSTKLADNGKTNYTIVIPDEPLVTESRAAEELASYLEQVSGANLRIVNEGTIKNISTDMKLISVGKTDLMDKAGLDYSNIDFKNDGFIEKTVGKTLFLCGGESNRSHLYVVYDFLETCLGCRFYTRDFEYIPTEKTIYLPILDVVDIPTFTDRVIIYNSLLDYDYAVKSRLSAPLANMGEEYGESYESSVGNEGHNFASEIVPQGIWRDKHPEWYYDDGIYTMFDPTYGVNEDGTYDDSMIDNPIDIAVESLKNQILDEPDAFYFNCSLNDSALTPNNPEYDKRAKKYGHSGVLIQFVSLVIERLDAWIAEETRPDGLFPNGRDYNLLMFAYKHTVAAPLDASGNPTVKCPDNLCIWLCPINVNVLYSIADPRQVEDQQTLIENWYKLTTNLSIWDYFGNFGDNAPLYYTYYFTTAPLTYKYYAKMNVQGFVQTQLAAESIGPYNAIQEMQTYVASKIMWDPYRYDTMELVRDYCNHYYGEYGEDIYEIIVQIEDHHAIMQNSGRSLYMNHSKLDHAEYFPLAVLENGINVIEEDLSDNQQSSIDAGEKARLDKRLKQFQLILRSHILKEYSTYHGNKDGYKEWSDTFFELIYEVDFADDYLGKRVDDKFLEWLELGYKVD